jgi:hypothetical protein
VNKRFSQSTQGRNGLHLGPPLCIPTSDGRKQRIRSEAPSISVHQGRQSSAVSPSLNAGSPRTAEAHAESRPSDQTRKEQTNEEETDKRGRNRQTVGTPPLFLDKDLFTCRLSTHRRTDSRLAESRRHKSLPTLTFLLSTQFLQKGTTLVYSLALCY